jgi:hypothetical protein
MERTAGHRRAGETWHCGTYFPGVPTQPFFTIFRFNQPSEYDPRTFCWIFETGQREHGHRAVLGRRAQDGYGDPGVSKVNLSGYADGCLK